MNCPLNNYVLIIAPKWPSPWSVILMPVFLKFLWRLLSTTVFYYEDGLHRFWAVPKVWSICV